MSALSGMANLPAALPFEIPSPTTSPAAAARVMSSAVSPFSV